MVFFTEWITNIILFILLATILELLLPNSNMKRYVKMAVGLLLLVLMLNPILEIFTKNVDEWLMTINMTGYTDEKKLEKLIESKKIDIESNQRAYISEQMAVHLKREVEKELIESFSVKIKEIEVSLNDEITELTNDYDIIGHVDLTVEEVADENIEEKSMIETVEVVSINIAKSLPIESQQPIANEVQDFLAEAWQMEKDRISLVWEGGENNG